MRPVNSTASSSHETGFPRRLGPYVLASYLDEGGMGRVYLALGRGPEGEQLCVLKRFGNPRSRFSPEQVRENQERFRREAEISLLLSHPCIGRTVSHFEAGPESYLVSELIDGMTMDHLISSLTTDGERLAIPLAAHIAAQIARALGYIHDFRGLGLVHRDLTPSNVMLGKSGEVKVIDFGIAKATLTDDSLTRPHVLVGKPLWTAPEVVDGQKVDRRADLYALGLLFWYLLSGQDPEGHLDAPGAILPPPSTFNPEVSGAIDETVLRAIHANPSRRFQTATEFLDAIVPFIPTDYDGAKALAHQVYRYESALKNEAIAAEVARARPLLATLPPASRGSWKRAAAFIGPFAVLTSVGLWVLSRQDRPLPANGPTSPAPPSLPSPPPVPPPTPPGLLPRPPLAPPSPPPRPAGLSPRPSPPQNPIPPSPPEAPQPGPNELLAAAKDSYDAEDIPEALRLARAAAKRGGGGKAYVLIGTCLALTKDYTGARAAFEHALRLSPDDEQARRLLEKLGGEAPGKTP